MDRITEKERERLVLRADAKTLRDISAMLLSEGRFRALPRILESIADDILSVVESEEMLQ